MMTVKFVKHFVKPQFKHVPGFVMPKGFGPVFGRSIP